MPNLGTIDGRCMKEKAKRDMIIESLKKNPNGTYTAKGKCSKCGTGMARIMGADTAKKYLGKGGGADDDVDFTAPDEDYEGACDMPKTGAAQRKKRSSRRSKSKSGGASRKRKSHKSKSRRSKSGGASRKRPSRKSKSRSSRRSKRSKK